MSIWCGKRVKSKKIQTITIVFIFALFFSISTTFSLIQSTAILQNLGRISSDIVAASGSATDIQAAVNIAAASGGGKVFIPNGTWDFVAVGQTWRTVTIPASVSVFGATTDKNSTGYTNTWKTLLRIPWKVPTTPGAEPTFFTLASSSGNPLQRISDIEFVGYRDLNPSAVTESTPCMYYGIQTEDAINFRIDHCYFRNLGEAGYRGPAQGLIDHCYFVNTVGAPFGSNGDWDTRTVGYGINVWGGDTWDTNIQNVMGKLSPYTIVVENSLFTRWRHCIDSNGGAHVIFRYNIIFNDTGYGSVDIHESSPPYMPARGDEIYGNQFLNPYFETNAIWVRAGSAFVWNNTFVEYGTSGGTCVGMFQNQANSMPAQQVHDTYIWSNNFNGAPNTITVWYGSNNPITQNVDYFLYQPSWYVPYQYPHPLDT